MNSLLDFEYSPWLVLLCLVTGAGYSYLQYQKKSPWSKEINISLAVVRAFLVAVLSILLLGPTIRAIKNYFEKPLLVIAIDNSKSVALTTDSIILQSVKNNLAAVTSSLQENGWEVKQEDLLGHSVDLDSLKFDATRTNLTEMVRNIQQQNDGANLAGILVVSDGIFNTGFSPDFISTFTKIYGIGVGDTIPRHDLSIIDVKHNKTVYQGNKYPVEISIRNEGLGPATTELLIYQGRELLDKVKLTIAVEDRLIKHQFLVPANKPGKQRITIVLDSIPGELTTINNRASFYIDVIEGQQKVLIVADAPSPDIKAMRLAIEQNEHFIVDVLIAGTITKLDYDLIILDELPTVDVLESHYTKVQTAKLPKLFVIGRSTDISQLNRDGVINFQTSKNQFDQVTANLNLDFKSFSVDADLDTWLGTVPPVTVPFGKLALAVNDEVLLYQRVGSVNTNVPLIYFSDNETKQGVIIGNGFWKWRLNEYQKNGKTEKFDALITKTIMYLASKPDNRQFKMYPVKESYEFGENILFTAETYNELFEPIAGEPVRLKISQENFIKEYNFTPLEGSRQLNIEDLPEGIYNYTAQTNINGKLHKVSGQFSVEIPDLEAADLTADFTMLRKLAKESGGKFYTDLQLNQLQDDFATYEAPAIIHSQEKEILILNLPWILILLIVLFSGEWLTRKMMGGY